MSKVDLTLRYADGRFATMETGYDPTSYKVENTNPQRYYWDVSGQNLTANETYALTCSPNSYKKVGQQTANGILTRVHMEQGAGGGGKG